MMTFEYGENYSIQFKMKRHICMHSSSASLCLGSFQNSK